jgi:uncharacterized RDD family membrane protein YckC
VIDMIIITAVQVLAFFIAIIVYDQLAGMESLIGPAPVEYANGLIVAVLILILFVLNWGYFVIFEMIWNGQSPGKRIAKLRVVRMDGSPIGFIESVIRNLIRFIDMIPSGYAVGIITMFLNRQSRRLGDLAAGTIVVKDRAEMRLDDLQINRTPTDTEQAQSTPSDLLPPVELPSGATEGGLDDDSNDWYIRFPGLRRMTPDEFGLVNDLLLRFDRGTVEQTVLRRAARALALKLDADPPEDNWVAARQFLLDLSAAYSARR